MNLNSSYFKNNVDFNDVLKINGNQFKFKKKFQAFEKKIVVGIDLFPQQWKIGI